jgi:very-short-patch-repair endonuclease
MTAPELRAFVRAVLDELKDEQRGRVIDSLMTRAVRGDVGWKPNRPSPRIVNDARSFAHAAQQVGHADPDDVSEYLRLASKAFLAGDHASARAVFEALLIPISTVDIDLGQHELVDDVLSVDVHTCVAQYVTSVYTILLPASAVPDWPADVVLPSDPVWKRDYSGSVRRLIRDGVDTPLASLFVHAARAMPEGAEGAERARSASEAFLYRRLDTLKETNGRFRLNVALPIAFDGFGTLEVDLLCADARVAIELDGGQHLTDPVAYRRDRRKDQLLQENGYFVLRFLAEDVGKDLDAVLDAILRVLARGRRSAAKAEPLKFVRRGSE